MAEKANKTTHAQRRRIEAHDATRRKLRAGQYIRRLKEIAGRVEDVDAAKVPALRLKADIYIRLLAKCLPDLKAIEHSGEIGAPAAMSRDEIIERIAQIHADTAVPDDGRSARGVDEPPAGTPTTH